MNSIREIMFRRVVLPGAAAVIVLSAACYDSKGAPKVPLGQRAAVPSPATTGGPAAAGAPINDSARLALDSGNVLFRKKVYPGALEQYRVAAQRAPEHAAPLFGIYMVARAMNKAALADSALAGIKARTGETPASPHLMVDSARRSGRSS